MASEKITSKWAGLLLLLVGPITIALLLFRAEEFDPVPIPNTSSRASLTVPARNDRVLRSIERVGDGLLPGPEDLAYDAEAHVLYTGCGDGWIKRVTVSDSAESSKVENWVHVGGRPLGLAFGPDKQLFVANAYKGLLRITKEGAVEVLTKEAEGVKFLLTDGVDVAGDGVIYFTDASDKYKLHEYMLDILEGHPNGRLMSFDPSMNQTRVLARDLYFANGVALSPQHDFIVFCETVVRRCRKYHIQGEKKGSIDNFIDNLPGFPDNIRYDGEDHFWIALATGRTYFWYVLMKYPFARKALAMLERIVRVPNMQKYGGLLCVSLQGEAVALYTDPALSMVTSGLKIANHVYYGSLGAEYISRLDLTRHAARSA
ncbi:protein STRICTOSIDINE SYNTHASE-LIKE 5-like isoform X1 [Tasmannia lanceolata]|uniref:protein STRICTOSIDINE SYNTHASE-LIKE 5-like isoform X1 n=1 Tax=Tasmannia lanceolata TaxID=3420 RepID=UPI0040630205